MLFELNLYIFFSLINYLTVSDALEKKHLVNFVKMW